MHCYGWAVGVATLLVLVPADAPGIATDGKWNTLGMRATFSPSVTFTGVRVPRDAARPACSASKLTHRSLVRWTPRH